MPTEKTSLFSDNVKTVTRIQDFSDKPSESLTYHLQQYYLAQSAFENYTEAVALFGTRRLGKTVALNQLWDKYHTDNSVYLKISEGAQMYDVVSYLREKGKIDCLFIDEITNILALDMNAADLLDYCKAYNIKVVTTGTNSLLLAIAINNSACGRFNVISFNPPNLMDLMYIKGTTLSEFIFGENTLYLGRNYLEDISNDIIHSIDYLGDYHNEPMYPISSEDLIRNIEIMVELIIFQKDSKLPRSGLIFSRKFYKNLDFDEVIYRTQSKKEIVYYIYNILLKLNLVLELPVHNLTDEVTHAYKLYLTTPVIYSGLLQKYSKEVLPTKLGVLFESVVVSQIMQIFDKSTNFRIYTFRDDQMEIEYDLVIEDGKHNIVYLNEIKYSGRKYGKYKNNAIIEEYFKDMEVKYVDITSENLLTILEDYKKLKD